MAEKRKTRTENETDEPKTSNAPKRRPLWKTIAMAVGGLVLLLFVTGGSYAGYQAHAYDTSVAKVYDVPIPDVKASTDPEVIARGKHLSESIGACAMSDCHGSDLAGGRLLEMGPVGSLSGPNITSGGKLADYSDGEIFRLIRHALRRDGRSVQFMPVHEINWLPDEDVIAIISYLRTVPASDKETPPTEIGLLGKVLDRRDDMHLDIARRLDHDNPSAMPSEPTPTAAYGAFIARACMGCHGTTLSGGPIPGAPPDLPTPTNITPHESGIGHYDFAAFEKLLETGVKPDGSKLDPFMPYESLANMNEVERKALWAYLESLPPKPFGNR